MSYRISVDTGGTFTDVVVADPDGNLTVGKSLTTPDRIFNGMKGALEAAAAELGIGLDDLLGDSQILIYGTTRATNAIVTGNTAKTAFLTTEGFPDILVYKEGGKWGAHDFSRDYPKPYVARRHTFEIPERVNSEGEIDAPMDEARVREILSGIRERGFGAIAVCLLWSIANPAHEERLGEMIEEILPGVPYTLSHRLAPIIREYRRASATAIDASLKPLMQAHLVEMEQDLRAAGFKGEALVSTSVGGCMHVEELVERPIHTVKSGPAMAPLAGKTFSEWEDLGGDVVICDTGGTTFDVGLVRAGEMVHTRDTWLGPQWEGHILGTSSVDVRSVGAGGGSIAWVDPGGLLRVGPQSAGSVPGPAAYGQGGDQPTVTDAAVVLGYLDPDYFLGGRMNLDVAAAKRVVGALGEQIGKNLEETAFAIMSLANELMIKAIQDITVREGFNPRESAFVAGGGAAGLNIGPIARELNSPRVVIPKAAGALSAAGMQFANIVNEQSANRWTLSGDFDFDGVNAALQGIEDYLNAFVDGVKDKGVVDTRIEFLAEARYQFQVWELDVPLTVERFKSQADVDAMVEAFHEVHERVFAVRDEQSQVEVMNWKGRVTARIASFDKKVEPKDDADPGDPYARRPAYFGDGGYVDTPIFKGGDLTAGSVVPGPAVIEEPTTTLVVYPGMRARVSGLDNFILELG